LHIRQFKSKWSYCFCNNFAFYRKVARSISRSDTFKWFKSINTNLKSQFHQFWKYVSTFIKCSTVPWGHMAGGLKALRTVNLDTRWKWAISHFTFGAIGRVTYRTEGWMDSRFRLDAMEERKISWPSRESGTDSPCVQHVHLSLYLLRCRIYTLQSENKYRTKY
jgi:hypothetical protein